MPHVNQIGGSRSVSQAPWAGGPGAGRASRRSGLRPPRRYARGLSSTGWRVSSKQLIETVELLFRTEHGFQLLTKAIDTTTSGFFRGACRIRTLHHPRADPRPAGSGSCSRPQRRPAPALTHPDLAAAEAMLGDPEIPVEEIARRLKVAPSALYRHLPGGGSALSG
jgi:hypothetical protein